MSRSSWQAWLGWRRAGLGWLAGLVASAGAGLSGVSSLQALVWVELQNSGDLGLWVPLACSAGIAARRLGCVMLQRDGADLNAACCAVHCTARLVPRLALLAVQLGGQASPLPALPCLPLALCQCTAAALPVAAACKTACRLHPAFVHTK